MLLKRHFSWCHCKAQHSRKHSKLYVGFGGNGQVCNGHGRPQHFWLLFATIIIIAIIITIIIIVIITIIIIIIIVIVVVVIIIVTTIPITITIPNIEASPLTVK